MLCQRQRAAADNVVRILADAALPASVVLDIAVRLHDRVFLRAGLRLLADMADPVVSILVGGQIGEAVRRNLALFHDFHVAEGAGLAQDIRRAVLAAAVFLLLAPFVVFQLFLAADVADLFVLIFIDCAAGEPFDLLCAFGVLPAVQTVFAALAVLAVAHFRMLVLAFLFQSAVLADVQAVGCFLCRPMVVDRQTAACQLDAVADDVAAVTDAAADVPAVGQRVAQRQRVVAALRKIVEIMLVHAVAGIFAAVDGVQPAGALGEIKFADAHPAGRVQRNIVADDAAPERRQSRALAELIVDLAEHRLFVIGARACVIYGLAENASAQRLEIETRIELPGVGAIGAVKAERIKGRVAEGIVDILAPERLGNNIRNRLVVKHVVLHRADDAHAEHAQIDADGNRRARLLALVHALAVQRQGQIPFIAIAVVGVDGKRMHIAVALVRVFGIQGVFLRVIAGGVFDLFLIEHDGQAIRADVLEHAAVVVQTPRRDAQQELRFIRDLLSILQIDLNFHLFIAALLVMQQKYKAVAPAVFIRRGQFKLIGPLIGVAAGIERFGPGIARRADAGGDRPVPAGASLIKGQLLQPDRTAVLAGDGELEVLQLIVFQLIVEDHIRICRPAIFAGYGLLCPLPVDLHAVAQLCAHIPGVGDGDLERLGLSGLQLGGRL